REGGRYAAPLSYGRPQTGNDRRSVATERFPAREFVVDQSFEDGRIRTQRQFTATCALLCFTECEGLDFCQCPCFVRDGCIVVVDRFPTRGAFDWHSDFGERAERACEFDFDEYVVRGLWCELVVDRTVDFVRRVMDHCVCEQGGRQIDAHALGGAGHGAGRRFLHCDFCECEYAFAVVRRRGVVDCRQVR